MPTYQTKNGTPTDAFDLKRELWYSAGATCGFWTDDWSLLKDHGGIPCCPFCGCVGMQTNAADWFGGAADYQEQGHPHYVDFVNLVKGSCAHSQKTGLNFLQRYEQWVKEREPGQA